MFLEMIKSEGLAHLSYVLGDGHQAVVIDPRRDCDIYIDYAHRQGAQISHIFETHRNEDYVIGSLDLARRTGATIHHGESEVMQFGYGKRVCDGDSFEVGKLLLRVLNTPGHTFESISLALIDQAFSEEPIGVFTGDTLFIGDVGRADFYPERAREVAGLLYDSIHNKLLPLGDQTILYPAHGAGSVCGSGMAAREFSTLGYERKHNPRLQMDREAFIDFKAHEHHYQPPYFREMERLNQYGPKALTEQPRPRPMTADQFAAGIDAGMIVLDVRSAEAAAGALIPGSLVIPLHMISAFAGWYLPYDRDIGLLTHNPDEVSQAVEYLLRLGYTRVIGYLDGGMHAWEITGRDYDTIPAIYAGSIKARMEQQQSYTLLDVRSIGEFTGGHLPDSTHIYVGKLLQHLEEIPSARPVTTFCGSGERAVIGASLLRMHGFERVEVCLGSMAACRRIGCQTVTEQQVA